MPPSITNAQSVHVHHTRGPLLSTRESQRHSPPHNAQGQYLFVSTAKSVLNKRPHCRPPPRFCQPATKSTAAAAQAPTGTIARTASRAIHPATLLLQVNNNLSHSTKCAFIARQCLRSRAVVKQFSFNLVYLLFLLWHHRSSCTEYRRIWPVRTSLTKRG